LKKQTPKRSKRLSWQFPSSNSLRSKLCVTRSHIFQKDRARKRGKERKRERKKRHEKANSIGTAYPFRIPWPRAFMSYSPLGDSLPYPAAEGFSYWRTGPFRPNPVNPLPMFTPTRTTSPPSLWHSIVRSDVTSRYVRAPSQLAAATGGLRTLALHERFFCLFLFLFLFLTISARWHFLSPQRGASS